MEGQAPAPDPDLTHRRAVVDGFFVAARDGDFDALLGVLDPDVVVRPTAAGRSRQTVVIHGARAAAARAVTGTRFVRPALTNGAAGCVVAAGGRCRSWASPLRTVGEPRLTARPLW